MNPASSAAESACLLIREPGGHDRCVDLKESPIVIGRPAESGIQLDNSSVSRKHAELKLSPGGQWLIHDLGSRNGTLINGKPAREHPLVDGDRIGIGGFQLQFIQQSTKDPAAPANRTRTRIHVADTTGGSLSTLEELAPPRVSASHLITLTDLSAQFARTSESADRLHLLCSMMVHPPFCANWTMVLRIAVAEPDEGPQTLVELQGSESESMGRSDAQGSYVSRSVLREVLKRREGVLASNMPNSLGNPVHNIEMSISVETLAIAAIACPLRVDGEHLDLLYMTLPPHYGTGEWLALASLAVKQYQQAEAAWEARNQAVTHAALKLELENARSIQTRLLPRKNVLDGYRERGLDLAIRSKASQQVGGDYADALLTKDGSILLVVADVCGHGLAAALVAASLHTFIHSGVRARADLVELIDGLNEHLCHTLPADTFVTLVTVLFDPKVGTLQCINAGHPPPMIISAEDACRRLESGVNFPLGITPTPLAFETAQLEIGEMLALYTDGLTEQTDSRGCILGIDGLGKHLKCIGNSCSISAEDAAVQLDLLLAKRLSDLRLEDDRTFLLARRVEVNLESTR